jgi:hypothetical protein
MLTSRRVLLLAAPIILLAAAFVLRARRVDAPHRVLVLLAESGPASHIGGAERMVLEARIAELEQSGNPLPFTVEYFDTRSDPASALTEFRELMRGRSILAVIGPRARADTDPCGQPQHRRRRIGTHATVGLQVRAER